MSKYLIIHGHFYQPPRENPWILAIEPQDSAAPFANWNARIDRECYAPNTRSRLLNDTGQIKRLVNNYQYLSFNFGPTLLSWLQSADPDTYARVIEADKAAAARCGGHGQALAQVYNHIIMPLASERDKNTQVRWGLADFKVRYGRKAEGMWLAETAVDLKTLEIMAKEGLKFTVLSQTQAVAVRSLVAGTGKQAKRAAAKSPWQDVSGGRVDPREPYRVFWGPGARDYIDVFFYDGPVSRAIAFENLLSDGPSFLKRIELAFGEPRADGGPRLVNLATDGESYGHHFYCGDMALAWLFNHLEEEPGNDPIALTNYAQYLSMFPPQKEVRLIENSAWSCAHGVERWRSDCGCNCGGGGGQWNQKWRTPLRDGLNWLSEELAEIFEREAGLLVKDPWAARDAYIRVIFDDYSEEGKAGFARQHQLRELAPEDSVRLFRLMESQLMGLYMFTSCAWFFDDIAGLEPVQNLCYALRAIELTQDFTDTDLTAALLKFIAPIVPNDPGYSSGLEVWRRLVEPNRLSGQTLAAHWAAAEILEAPEALALFSVPAFTAGPITRIEDGGLEILAGSVELFDRRLGERASYQCLAIYSGGAHLAVLVDDVSGNAAALDWADEETLLAALDAELNALSALNIWDSMQRLMPRASRFVIDDLLPFSRGALLSAMVRDVYNNLKNHTRDLFQLNQHLLMTYRSSGGQMAWVERFIFRVMGEAELSRLLTPAATGKPVNMTALASALHKRGLVGIARDEATATDLSAEFLENHLENAKSAASPKRLFDEAAAFIRLIRRENFHFDRWKSQNLWHGLINDPLFMKRLSAEEAGILREIGDQLGFAAMKIPAPSGDRQ